MLYMKQFFRNYVFLGVVLAGMFCSSASWAISSCEFMDQLKRLKINAEILAIPSLSHDSARAQNAIRNIEILIRKSEGKEELLPNPVFDQGREEWLLLYLITWKRYVRAYQFSGATAANQLFGSTRYRILHQELISISRALNCEPANGSWVGAGVNSGVGVLGKLQALSGSLFSNDRFQYNGIPVQAAWVVLFGGIFIVTAVIWLTTLFDRYRKEGAKRYFCDINTAIFCNSEKGRAKILDISRTGAGISPDIPVKRGEILWIKIDGKKRRSRVMWVGENKIGIQFSWKHRKIPRSIDKGKLKQRELSWRK